VQSNTTRGAKTLYPRLTAERRTTFILERCATPSQSRLRSQLEELLAADRGKDESLAVLLHEVRSPLAVIQNAIPLASDFTVRLRLEA
jgi:signal transduction histidine kinase